MQTTAIYRAPTGEDVPVEVSRDERDPREYVRRVTVLETHGAYVKGQTFESAIQRLSGFRTTAHAGEK